MYQPQASELKHDDCDDVHMYVNPITGTALTQAALNSLPFTIHILYMRIRKVAKERREEHVLFMRGVSVVHGNWFQQIGSTRTQKVKFNFKHGSTTAHYHYLSTLTVEKLTANPVTDSRSKVQMQEVSTRLSQWSMATGSNKSAQLGHKFNFKHGLTTAHYRHLSTLVVESIRANPFTDSLYKVHSQEVNTQSSQIGPLQPIEQIGSSKIKRVKA